MNFLLRLWHYCASKVSEVKQMDYRDMVAASVIAEAQAVKQREEKTLLPIEDLLFFHKIDRESALQKVREREATLKKHKKEILKSKQITQAWLVKHFPSITHFKAVPYENKYVVYEGNGRLMAMQHVFGSGVKVEVDLLILSKDLTKKFRKVRKMNGLE